MIACPCVVDTNVPVVANNRSEPLPSDELLIACVRALQEIRESGHIVLDSGGEIFQEYWRYLRWSREPGVGDIFIKWVFNNQYNSERCTLVSITRREGDDLDYREFPRHPKLTKFDRSDRKFVAVALAHGKSTPIVQASDTKWIGWAGALLECGVRVVFLCEGELREKHEAKRRKKLG